MKKLENRVVFVTGGGDGIGRATVVEAAKEGAIVAFAELSEKNATETVEILKEMNAEVTSYVLDVTNEEALVNALKDAEAKYGKIDVLVNNVGYVPRAYIHELTTEQWNKYFDINLKAPYIGARTVLPGMMERKSGSIINITSTTATKPLERSAVYGTTKAAVLMFTKALALDYAKYGIRVNSVCPGLTLTNLVKGACTEEYIETLKKDIPLGRLGMPEDTAKAIINLVSDDCSFVTGINMEVAGGMTLV